MLAEIKCKQCNKIFQVENYRKDKVQFCSHICYGKNMLGEKRKPCTEITKIKIGNANRGRRNGMYGKKAWNSDSKGLTVANSGSFKKGIVPWNTSKKMINKFLAKMEEENKVYKRVAWNKGTRGIMPRPWNKGIHTGIKPWFGKKRPNMIGNKFAKGTIAWNRNKKGIHLSPQSEFKKGLIPWNKNKEFFAIKGAKNYAWKGGITKLVESIRKCFKYSYWRTEIYNRDNFTCQMPGCNKINKSLNAHHIKPFRKIIEENKITTVEQALDCKELWDINMGITLCKKCHKNMLYHESDYFQLFTDIIKNKNNFIIELYATDSTSR